MDFLETKLTDELARRNIPLAADEFIDAVLAALDRTPDELSDGTGG